MRKVILNVAVSLDGYIEGPKGEYDWCFTDGDYGMCDFLKRTDTIFFGRKSFEILTRSEPGAYPDKRKYVFSKSLRDAGADWEIIGDGFETRIREIKNQPGKDIWLFGGANLAASLLNAGLIEEMQLSIHPLLLGGGKPLFSGIKERTHFALADSKPFSTGLIQLFYRRL
jgi:dihydrofolate reductase